MCALKRSNLRRQNSRNKFTTPGSTTTTTTTAATPQAGEEEEGAEHGVSETTSTTTARPVGYAFNGHDHHLNVMSISYGGYEFVANAFFHFFFSVLVVRHSFFSKSFRVKCITVCWHFCFAFFWHFPIFFIFYFLQYNIIFETKIVHRLYNS